MTERPEADPVATTWRCRIFGHRPHFWADGRVMRWECGYGCGTGGSKVYLSDAEARRYAAAFDRRGDADLGKRAPLIGMFPLRLWRRLWKDSR